MACRQQVGNLPSRRIRRNTTLRRGARTSAVLFRIKGNIFKGSVPPQGSKFHKTGSKFHKTGPKFHKTGPKFHKTGPKFHKTGPKFHKTLLTSLDLKAGVTKRMASKRQINRLPGLLAVKII